MRIWRARASVVASCTVTNSLRDPLILPYEINKTNLVGVPRWPVVVGGQPRYSDLAAGGDQPEDRTLRTVVVAQGQEPHRLADRWQLVFHSVSFLSTVAGVPTATEIRHLFANYRKSIPPCRPAKSPRHRTRVVGLATRCVPQISCGADS